MYYTDFDKIPRHHYDVIYIDPPWRYGDKFSGHSFSIDHEYTTLSVGDIKALPIQELCHRDALYFQWVTSPQLPVGLEVMKAHGFKYRTVAFCWSKLTAHGKEVANLGRWTMGNVELCLLGVRGHPQRALKNVRQLVRAVRGRHSEKPAIVRDRIMELVGGGHHALEVFARGDAAGWDQWGNSPDGR